MSTHPEQSCSTSSIKNGVSQTSAYNIKTSPLITSTPAVHCEPVNVSDRVDQLNSRTLSRWSTMKILTL